MIGKQLEQPPASQHGEGSAERTVTRLLLRWTGGDPAAIDDVVPEVLAELQRIARGLMRRESPDHTLQPTALVHELYLRLRGSRTVSWKNRAHFFSFAGEAMRRILVDHARARGSRKRGAGWCRVELEESLEMGVAGSMPDAKLLALDAALERLGELDERQCRIVELRFFLGMSVEEVSQALDLSPTTIHRDWALARSWLYRELEAAGRKAD